MFSSVEPRAGPDILGDRSAPTQKETECRDHGKLPPREAANLPQMTDNKCGNDNSEEEYRKLPIFDLIKHDSQCVDVAHRQKQLTRRNACPLGTSSLAPGGRKPAAASEGSLARRPAQDPSISLRAIGWGNGPGSFAALSETPHVPIQGGFVDPPLHSEAAATPTSSSQTERAPTVSTESAELAARRLIPANTLATTGRAVRRLATSVNIAVRTPVPVSYQHIWVIGSQFQATVYH